MSKPDSTAEDALARETELIRRAQEADLEAFDELVARNQAGAQRMAMMLGLNADDAADAAQEAFVRAYRAIGRFRLGEPFRPWLASIVANEVRGSWRKSARRLRLAEKIATLPEAHLEGPEAGSLQAERSRTLIAAVQALREHDRLPIIYRYFLEFSEAETADALKVPRGTVKSRLSRALARLRDGLGDDL